MGFGSGCSDEGESRTGAGGACLVSANAIS